MKHTFLPILVILITVLSACSPASAPSPAATPITMPSSTPIPPVAGLPTATPLPPTLAPTATAGAIATPAGKNILLEEQCINIEQQPPADLALSGVLVINRANPYLENMATQKDVSLTLEGGGTLEIYEKDVAISPDGMLMAYIDKYYGGNNHGMQKRILRVVRSSGDPFDMSFWNEDWQWLIGWTDNQNLAVSTSAGEVVLINPFTRSKRTFVQPLWVWEKRKNHERDYYYYWGGLATNYSPNLAWYIDQTDWQNFDLKNVASGETVAQFDNGSGVAWSADGARLAVAEGNLLEIVENGKRVSGFTLPDQVSGFYAHTQFSPDGQKLAFNAGGDYMNKLSILDLPRRSLFSLCQAEYNTWSAPFWSPDSRYVIEEIHDEDYNSYDVLVDTQQMRAYLLHSGELQHRFAWLAKPTPQP